MAKRNTKKKDPALVEFARLVRTRRQTLLLSQEQLAEKSDLHVNFVGGLERATRNPSLTSIIKLSKALKLSPKDLVPEN
jgi:transcriptional regulator with XRE-family HTH domain